MGAEPSPLAGSDAVGLLWSTAMVRNSLGTLALDLFGLGLTALLGILAIMGWQPPVYIARIIVDSVSVAWSRGFPSLPTG